MIDSLVERIKISSSTVESKEISDTVKLSGMAAVLGGLGTGTLGAGITYLAMKKNRREEEEKARNKALLYGVAGALGGFGVGRSTPPANMFGSSALSSDPGSLEYGFNDQDMQYIMGRR